MTCLQPCDPPSLELREGWRVYGQYLGPALGEITCFPFFYGVCGADVILTVLLINFKGVTKFNSQPFFFKIRFKPPPRVTAADVVANRVQTPLTPFILSSEV